MITAGIDMGSKTVKVVILKDGVIIGKAKKLAGFESRISAQDAFDEAIEDAGIANEDIQSIISTGAGRRNAPYTKKDITDVGANSLGVVTKYPGAVSVVLRGNLLIPQGSRTARWCHRVATAPSSSVASAAHRGRRLPRDRAKSAVQPVKSPTTRPTPNVFRRRPPVLPGSRRCQMAIAARPAC